MLNCHDEKAGFERFFELLDEFRQRDRSLNREQLTETGQKVHSAS